MKISDKLCISAGISIVLIIILTSVILIISNDITEKNKTHMQAMNIYTDLSELDIITYEYLLHHEERMEQQWNLKYNSIATVLESENGLLKSIRDKHAMLGNLFLQITANYEKRQDLI